MRGGLLGHEKSRGQLDTCKNFHRLKFSHVSCNRL